MRWLPTFSLILAGSILLSSLIIGLCRALKHVGGFLNHSSCENNFIDRIAEGIISGGMFGISLGILWLILVQYAAANEVDLFYAISIGGVLGPLLIEIFKRTTVTTRRIADNIAKKFGNRLTLDETARIIGGMSFGAVVGGITVAIGSQGLGGDLGLFGDILGGVILGVCLCFWLYGLVIGWGAYQMLPVVKRLADMVYAEYVVFVSREKTVICGECLRYSFPLKSTYQDGVRYCEYCQNIIEHTTETGKVVLTFGIVLDKPTGQRVFLLSNPDFERKEAPFDVTHVYIDTKTCNVLLLERFLTYILNYPPVKGLQSVQIVYQGVLDDLGEHFKNALHNTFTHIQQFQ